MAYCRVSIISNIQHIGPLLDDPNHIWDALSSQKNFLGNSNAVGTFTFNSVTPAFADTQNIILWDIFRNILELNIKNLHFGVLNGMVWICASAWFCDMLPSGKLT